MWKLKCLLNEMVRRPIQDLRLLLAALLVTWGASVIPGQVSRGIDPQKLWGLVIGISNYAHAEPLQYAASDAQEFSEFLQSPRGGSIPADHIVRLIEDQASRTGILLALDSIQEKVQNGDSICIYLAGHGYLRHRAGYFIPSDGDLRSAPASAIAFVQLKEMIESGLAHAKTRILITDVCHAGKVGAQPTALAEKIQNLINEEFLKLRGGSGTFLNLLASRPSETSYEREDLGRGVFTHTLLEALNGKAAFSGDLIVDAQRVVEYVRNEVPKYTAGQQHPIANQDFDPKLALSYLDKPGPEPKLARGGTVLEIINGDKSAFTRVQWTDPATDAIAVRQLPRDQGKMQISALVPGTLKLSFFDEGNRIHQRDVVLGPGRNTLDLLTAKSGWNFNLGRLPGYLASLSPALPLKPLARLQGPPPSATPEEGDATLLLRADQATQVYVDGAYFGNSEGNDRFLQLEGFSPGIHKVTLVASAEREQRFRVKLFAGKQILDPPTGELRFVAAVRPPASTVLLASGDIPGSLQESYRQLAMALWEERLIEPAGNSAWDYYQGLRDRLPTPARDRLRQALIVGIGNRAQRIILKYLRGGDIRWSAAVFDEGSILTERLVSLFKSTPTFQSQQSFFSGRAAIERGQYSQAIQALQRCVSLDPEAGHAYNAMGLAYWKQNLLDRAIPALRQAIALSPQWTYPRITLALVYLEQRRYQEAEQTFQEALQIDGEDSAGCHGLAQLYFLLGRLPEAQIQVQRAVDFGPGNAYAYETLGKIRESQQRYPEAEEAYRLALRMEPDESSFQVSLAELLRRLGRLQEAQQIFAGIADRYPDNLRVVQAYVGFLKEGNRTAGAEAAIARAIGKSPGDANLRVLYGGFLRELGRDRDAEKQLRSALQIAPDNAYAHHDLAVLYLARKQTASAEGELALAFKADPRLAAPHKLLGQIRFAQNRLQEAIREYRKALELSIDANQQSELKEEIAKTERELVRLEIESAKRKAGEGKRAEAWAVYCAALQSAPASRDLRDAILQFLASYSSSADLSLLPSGVLSDVLKTSFWKAQQRAEEQWQTQQKVPAIQAFVDAIDGMDPSQRRVVASTEFNLGNESFGLHGIVHRWALRMIEERDYRKALGLLESTIRQGIFARIPDYNPVTIDSLCIRPDFPQPKSISDYDIAHHADRRAHEVYAAALAGAGDMDGARKYLVAIESIQPDLRARLLVARSLQLERKWTDAASVLKEGLANPDFSRQSDFAAEVYTRLAEIQCLAGNCDAARDTLMEARRILPGNKAIEVAIKKLPPK